MLEKIRCGETIKPGGRLGAPCQKTIISYANQLNASSRGIATSAVEMEETGGMNV